MNGRKRHFLKSLKGDVPDIEVWSSFNLMYKAKLKKLENPKILWLIGFHVHSNLVPPDLGDDEACEEDDEEPEGGGVEGTVDLQLLLQGGEHGEQHDRVGEE